MLTVVAGAPFSGKDRWIAAEIERRESGGARGLLALSYTALFAALVPRHGVRHRVRHPPPPLGDSPPFCKRHSVSS